MGLCFSYQHQKDLDFLSSYITNGPLFGDCVEVLQCVLHDSTDTPSNAVNVIEASTTCESKRVQAELVQEYRPVTPITPIPTTPLTSTPTISTPTISLTLPITPTIPLTPTSMMTPEALARDERRRKRDERRAARVINGSCSPVSDISLSVGEHLDDRCKINIQTYYPYDKKKKYLVLDIDYTIFDHKSDFDFALEFKRPYLHEFLKTCYAHYNIIIWSATAFYHIQTKMEKLQLLNHPDFHICSVLSRDHMIPYAFSIKRKTYIQDIKPLSLLWKKFPEIINPGNTIHIDDVEENFVLNQRNGLRIDPFREALLFRQTDRELFYLAQYLTIIAELPSFEPLDHYRWKDYVINTLWSLQTVISLPPFSPPAPASPALLQQHHQSQDLKRVLKEKARDDAEKERNMRAEEQRRSEETRVEAELRIETGDLKEHIMERNARLEQELDNLAKAAMADSDRRKLKQPSPNPNRTPQQRPSLSPLLTQQPSANTPQQITPPQKLTLSPQLSPLGQFNPQKLTLSNLNPQKLTLSPKTNQPMSPQLTITRPPSPFSHQPRASSPVDNSLQQSPAQQHEGPKRSKGRDKEGLRHRRATSGNNSTSNSNGNDGLVDGVRKADWVVTDVQLLDLIRHPPTDIVLPLHTSPQCARG